MKNKAVVFTTLVLGFAFGLVFAPGLSAQEEQQNTVIIPKEIQDVFQEGITTQQARPDIPFSILQHLYLPAQQNRHNVFFFSVKNVDLGFEAVMPPGEAAEKKEEEQEESSFQATPAQLRATSHVFLYFKQLDGEFAKEVYVPVRFQADGAAFDPEEEMICSVGYPLPVGKYLLAMAIASKDLSKIGTQYLEFNTPGPHEIAEGLVTTPIFYVKNLARMESPETTTEIHKDFFTYSVLQVTPNLAKTFKAGDNLDIFFFVFGAQSNESGQFDISVNYEVMLGDDVQIKYADTKYVNPLVSQPLPLKKTVVTTTTLESGEKKEKKETKDLEPGSYILKMVITDSASGKKIEKTIDFEMK